MIVIEKGIHTNETLYKYKKNEIKYSINILENKKSINSY